MAIKKDKIRSAAQKYLQKGQIDKAIREFERLVGDDPKDVRTLLKIGDLQTRSGKNQEATATYARVAEFYSEQGFFLKAVAVYKQILKIDPGLIDTNLKLAELYQQLGLQSDASNQFRQISQIYEQQGQPDKAIEILQRMIEADPDSVASRIKLAEIYAQQDMTEEARGEFRAAAVYLKEQHRIDDYIKVAERIVHFEPGDLATTRELANIYVQKGDARRALAKLQVCFKADPRDIETLGLLANAFHDLGQIPKTVSVYRELASVHEESGDRQAYLGVMQQILDLQPDDVEAREALGAEPTAAASAEAPGAGLPATADADDDLELEGDLDDLDLDVEPARARPVEPQPTDDEALRRVLTEVDVYVKYGLKNKAVEHIAKALESHPATREIQLRYKDLLHDLGDTATAVGVLWQMATAAHRAGETDNARVDLQELLQIDPGHEDAVGLMNEIDPEGARAVVEDDLPSEIHVDIDDDFDVEAEGFEVEADGLEVEADGFEVEADGFEVEGDGFEVESDGFEVEGDGFEVEGDGFEVEAEESIDDEVVLEAPAADSEEDVVDLDLAGASEPFDLMVEADDLEDEPFEIAVGDQPTGEPALQAEATPQAPASGGLGDELEDLLAGAVPTRTQPPAAEPAGPVGLESEPDLGLEADAPLGLEADAGLDLEAASAVGLDAEDDIGLEAETVVEARPEADFGLEADAELGFEADAEVGLEAEPEVAAAPEPPPAEAEAGSAVDELLGLVGGEAPASSSADELVEEMEAELETIAAVPEPSPAEAEAGSAVDELLGLAGGAEAAPVSADELVEEMEAELETVTAGPELGLPEEISPQPGLEPESIASSEFEALTSAEFEALEEPPPPPEPAPEPEPEPEPEPATEPEPSAEHEPDLTDEIDEIEFFLQQGLEEEAQESLEVLLLGHPDHPELLALEAKLDAAASEPEAPGPAEPAAPAAAPAGGDEPEAEPEPETLQMEAVDIGAELEEELGGADDDFQVSFTDVFEDFKRGVAEQVEEGDYQTHYDLGIAYKEMGLLDDAVREFMLAAESDAHQIGALTMAGLCDLARGNTTEALEHFLAGLNSDGVRPEEALALRFEIGQAYESMGRFGEARRFYEKVHTMDGTFRDVADRLDEATRQSASRGGDVSHDLDALLDETDAEKQARDPNHDKISYL